MASSPPAAPPQAPSSCRTGRVVVLTGQNNKEVPVRLSIEPCQVGRMRVLTATSEYQTVCYSLMSPVLASWTVKFVK